MKESELHSSTLNKQTSIRLKIKNANGIKIRLLQQNGPEDERIQEMGPVKKVIYGKKVF